MCAGPPADLPLRHPPAQPRPASFARPCFRRSPGHNSTTSAEDETMLYDKDVLTTGEVAKICNVAPRTVSKWFDSGSLKGYRIPGSKDRRIPVSQLIRFMKAHGIPLDGTLSGRTRVLVVDDEKEIVDVLQKVLTEQANYDVRTATTGFAAGLECERFKPHVLLLDVHLGEGDSRALANLVKGEDELQMTKVVAMSGKMTDSQLAGLKGQGFESFLKKPFQVRQVIEAIEHCTALVH
ncbi:MAG: response regulator [Phycisphaerales bacterium]